MVFKMSEQVDLEGKVPEKEKKAYLEKVSPLGNRPISLVVFEKAISLGIANRGKGWNNFIFNNKDEVDTFIEKLNELKVKYL